MSSDRPGLARRIHRRGVTPFVCDVERPGIDPFGIVHRNRRYLVSVVLQESFQTELCFKIQSGVEEGMAEIFQLPVMVFAHFPEDIFVPQ